MQKMEIKRHFLLMPKAPSIAEALGIVEEIDLKAIANGEATQDVPYVHRHTFLSSLGYTRATREVRAQVRAAGWWDNIKRTWDDDVKPQEYFLRAEDLLANATGSVITDAEQEVVDNLHRNNELNDMLEIELAYMLLGEEINWNAYNVRRDIHLAGAVRTYVYSLGYTRGVRTWAGAEWLRFKTRP